MENEFAKHEIDYINDYQKLGYTDSYRLSGNHLVSNETKKNYFAKDVTIIKEHRYEGMSNPSDMSLLYVLEMSDKSKGTLLASYGPNADVNLYEFMSSIPEENKKDEDVLPPDSENER